MKVIDFCFTVYHVEMKVIDFCFTVYHVEMKVTEFNCRLASGGSAAFNNYVEEITPMVSGYSESGYLILCQFKTYKKILIDIQHTKRQTEIMLSYSG